LELRMMKVMV